MSFNESWVLSYNFFESLIMSASSTSTVEHSAQVLYGRRPQRGLASTATSPATASQPDPMRERMEARLRACDSVLDAVLVERAGLPLGRNQVAYLEARPGASIKTEALRARLAGVLEPEWLPSTLVVLDALPRLADGAVDRAALPAPDPVRLGTCCYEAPLGPVEQAVAALWRELLDMEQISRHDHFFELGGHSSLAVQLVYRLRRQLEVEVGMRDLFQSPTLQGFAHAVNERMQAGRASGLVAIRPEGGLRPLFLLHTGEGEIDYVHELAPWLDPDMPLYALAAHGLRAGERPLGSVEEMAASYVYAIRMVQPVGPYRVAGWGAGGVLAYEMANQLIGADQDVEFLGLVDTPSAYPWPASTAAAVNGQPGLAPVPSRFEDWLAQLGWVAPQLAPAVRAELGALAARGEVDALLLRGQQAGLLERGLEPDQLRRRMALRHCIALALSHYARPPLALPVTLLAAGGAGADGADPTLGWGAALGRRLRTTLLKAPRLAVMETPHIEQLGAALSEALRDAGAARSNPEEFSYAPRITIQGGSPSVAPLFCVPGAGASVTALAGLAGALDPAIPVHGLQPRGLCGALAPHIDVPSAARAYLGAMRGVQARGPYRLLGHSFGGWVVFEMARQLEAEGEQVSGLFVLDTDAPGAANPRFARAATLAKLVEIFQMSVERPIALGEADFAALDHEAQLALLLQRLIAVRLLPPRASVQMLRGIVRVFGANLNTDYQPQGAYDGVLHLVSVPDPGHEHERPQDPAELLRGWRACAPRTRYWSGPGNHMTLLAAPHVGRLAAYLNPLLKETA